MQINPFYETARLKKLPTSAIVKWHTPNTFRLATENAHSKNLFTEKRPDIANMASYLFHPELKAILNNGPKIIPTNNESIM
ncbi:hypothetical protein PUP68_24585 [Pseudomonas chlororaphis]|uniref:hypothetical protein n=1 Tax=Pseudomonas chlororaphis TaxID=587753 RepID=UPI0023675F57|nr:hypothetical protein [Pseudomonas chlororaphis]WDG82487.1 hypothetical protein PUP77_20275 [Pseudomonas chlororaphis]WDG88863.1 hypothetical protein PUP68_24585 [Pseudomonas chlororaphis]